MSHYNIAFINEVDSTNTFLKELVKLQNLKAPYCVSASQQTQGKGQRNKSWESDPFSNVLSSFLVTNIHRLEDLPKLNNAAALAVVETLRFFNLEEIKVKWPNDVYVNGKKVAGILTENVIGNQALKFGIVGVGLNVNQVNFENFQATSIKGELQKQVETVSVLHRLYDSFYHFIELGTSDLLERVNDLLYKQNELVTFEAGGRMDEYTIKNILVNGNLAVKKGDLASELEHHKVKWIK